MGVRLFIAVALCCVLIDYVYGASCPSSSHISSCGPKCTDHSNCAGAQMCCPNICSTKSCTDINIYASSNKDSNKGSSSKGGTGTYCGNLKCSAYEKCELDRTTKKQKCVRT